jgi:prepilin-type N-terminal cleavage/methylation domain-containing protein
MQIIPGRRSRARRALAAGRGDGAERATGRRAGARGFTLLEMLAVLAVISVIAAVATPGFVEMIRERRTQREAAMFSDAFRVARARALGRGAAVSVVMVDGDPAVALLYEHVDTAGLPLAGCRNQGVWRLVDRINGRPGGSNLILYSPEDGTTALTQTVICYTPRGRTVWASNTGGMEVFDSLGSVITETAPPAFNNLDGVFRIEVQRAEGATAGVARSIFVMSNGQTRVSL